MKTQTNTLTASDILLSDAIEAFRLHELADLSPQTQKWYLSRLQAFNRYLDNKDLSQIMETDLLQWREHLINKQTIYNTPTSQRPQVKKKLSRETVRGHIRALKRFFTWLHRTDIITADLAKDIKLPRPGKNGKKGISESNLRKILHLAKDNVRDYAILRFLESSGCRVAGVANLKLSDLNLDHPQPRMHRRVTAHEKGDKERTVIISQTALDALLAWLEIRPNVEFENVFLGKRANEPWHPLTTSGISSMIRRYKLRLELTGPCSPHQFRHRYCRHLLQSGMDLSRVSQLAGHEDPSITVRFYGIFEVDNLQTGYDEIFQDA